MEKYISYSRENLKLNLLKKKLNPTKFIFIFISRIEKEKEPLFALQLIYQLKKKGLDVEFKVIGDGTLFEKFKQRIKDLNLTDNVTLYGQVTDPNKIINIAKDADLLLHPGIIGLSTLISLSLGIPVITFNSEKQMPEFEALEENFNSIFIDLKSARDSSNKIMKLLDRDNLYNMSINSFSSISNNKEFSINYMKNNFVNCIKNYGI